LSRLPGIHPDKNETFVLDFANKAEEIYRALLESTAAFDDVAGNVAKSVAKKEDDSK